MKDHPIQGLMNTAMENIHDMVDVNTIIGDPVSTPDGSVIIPVSKVAFGFAAGGGEYSGSIDFTGAEEVTLTSENGQGEKTAALIPEVKYPFAGGSGAGVSLTPVAFLVVNGSNVKLLSTDANTTIDKLIDMIPGFVNKVCDSIKSRKDNKNNGKTNENGINGSLAEENADMDLI